MISSVIEVMGGGAINVCRPATAGVRGITEFENCWRRGNGGNL
jgi:hypothetical protein